MKSSKLDERIRGLVVREFERMRTGIKSLALRRAMDFNSRRPEGKAPALSTIQGILWSAADEKLEEAVDRLRDRLLDAVSPEKRVLAFDHFESLCRIYIQVEYAKLLEQLGMVNGSAGFHFLLSSFGIKLHALVSAAKNEASLLKAEKPDEDPIENGSEAVIRFNWMVYRKGFNKFCGGSIKKDWKRKTKIAGFLKSIEKETAGWEVKKLNRLEFTLKDEWKKMQGRKKRYSPK